MRGAHRIIVESRKVKYDFVVKRNITILTGNSGSGKTVLIDLIRDYRRYGADSGVFVSCDCECRTIDNEDWKRQIEEISSSIIFIDEGNRFFIFKRICRYRTKIGREENKKSVSLKVNLAISKKCCCCTLPIRD